MTIIPASMGVLGPRGARGYSLLGAARPPEAGDGRVGDWWIDTDAATVYGPKAGGGWPADPTVHFGLGDVTRAELEEAIATAIADLNLDALATDDEMVAAIAAAITAQDLSEYATNTYVGALIDTMTSLFNERVNTEETARQQADQTEASLRNTAVTAVNARVTALSADVDVINVTAADAQQRAINVAGDLGAEIANREEAQTSMGTALGNLQGDVTNLGLDVAAKPSYDDIVNVAKDHEGFSLEPPPSGFTKGRWLGVRSEPPTEAFDTFNPVQYDYFVTPAGETYINIDGNNPGTWVKPGFPFTNGAFAPGYSNDQENSQALYTEFSLAASEITSPLWYDPHVVTFDMPTTGPWSYLTQDVGGNIYVPEFSPYGYPPGMYCFKVWASWYGNAAYGVVPPGRRSVSVEAAGIYDTRTTFFPVASYNNLGHELETAPIYVWMQGAQQIGVRVRVSQSNDDGIPLWCGVQLEIRRVI